MHIEIVRASISIQFDSIQLIVSKFRCIDPTLVCTHFVTSTYKDLSQNSAKFSLPVAYQDKFELLRRGHKSWALKLLSSHPFVLSDLWLVRWVNYPHIALNWLGIGPSYVSLKSELKISYVCQGYVCNFFLYIIQSTLNDLRFFLMIDIPQRSFKRAVFKYYLNLCI